MSATNAETLLSEEAKGRILSAITSLVPAPQCSLCHDEEFTLADGFIFLPLVREASAWMQLFGVSGDKGLPCVAFVCKTCGNTYLINLHQLGLTELFP